MQLGIFVRTFAPAPLGDMLDACAAHDLRAVQFNMLCAGLEPMPDEIDPALCEQIRTEMAAARADDGEPLRHVQHDPPRSNRARPGAASAGRAGGGV